MQDALDRLGQSQHGLVTIDQLLGLGLGPREVQRWISWQRLTRIHEGVYRLRGVPRSRIQNVMAATLATDGVASHRSAAMLWGLFETEELDVTVVRGRAPQPVGVVVHRLADLDQRWVTTRSGIPVTDPLRLFVDLGAVLPLGIVALILDRALGRQLVTVAGVRAARDVVARRGRAGCGIIRTLLDERTDLARPAGVFEARMASLLARHGLPAPRTEYVVRDGDRFIGRVDFAYPEIRLAIEVDGFEAHSGLEVFRSDRARQNELVTLGWTLLRFTWDQVDRRDSAVAYSVRRARTSVLGRADTA